MDLNQVYTAPAIPKLGRRNIKSALITGAIKPQIALKKTNFSFVKSFVKPKIEEGLTTESLGPIIKKEGDNDKKFSIIESFLGSTNKILTQVQKQLAFDQLSRIAAERLQLEKDKKRISRKKVSDKEKKLEEPGKNSILPKIFDKITAPIKSIFQKLIDFFSIILTGLIVNNAFNWLSKKENQKKLKKFFDFVVDHWKEILIILGTAKLLGAILKIVRVARLLKKFIDLFKKKPPGGPPNCGCDDKKPKGGGPSDPCAPILDCIKDPTGPTAEALAEKIANTSRFKPLSSILGVTTLNPKPIQTPKPQLTANEKYLQSLPPGVREDALKSGKTSSPLGDLGIMAISAAVAYPFIAFISSLGIGGIGGIGGSGAAGGANNILRSASIPGKLSRATTLVGKSKGGTIPKFSSGGTIGKGDRPGTDTVPAMVRGGARIMLDADEEVINAKSSRVWRPTLKDINDNGARMWSQFVEGIKKQESTNTVQAENNTRFAKVLEDYDKVLKEEERRLRKKYNDAMLKNKPTPPGRGGAPSAAPTPKTSGGGGNNRAMPDASKPGALGDPGNPNSPRIGEQVGNLPPPKPKPKPTTSSASPESTASPIGLLPLKTKKPSTDNLSSLFSAKRKNLESLKPLGPSIKVFKIAETNSAIDLTNKNKVGSVPVSGGDPTPLPSISPINGLFAEAMGGWMTSLGIGIG